MEIDIHTYFNREQFLISLFEELVHDYQQQDLCLDVLLNNCANNDSIGAVIHILKEVDFDFVNTSVIKIINSGVLPILKFAFEKNPTLSKDSNLARTAIIEEQWDCLKYLLSVGVPTPRLDELPSDWIPSKEGAGILISLGLHIEVDTCDYLFTMGSDKGKKCGRTVPKGKRFCSRCVKRGAADLLGCQYGTIEFLPYLGRVGIYWVKPYGIVAGIKDNQLIALFVDEKGDGNKRDLTFTEKQLLLMMNFKC